MGALDFAGGTVVHVNAGVAALVAAIVVGKRRDYRAVAAPAAQRAVHAARRRPAVVRLVRVQRRQRAGRQRRRRAGVHHDVPRADGHAGRLDAARLPAHGKPTAVGAATGHRRRSRRHHAGGRLHRPDERDRPRRRWRRFRATSACLWRAKTVARRFARRRRRARRRRHRRRAAHRRLRAEER